MVESCLQPVMMMVSMCSCVRFLFPATACTLTLRFSLVHLGSVLVACLRVCACNVRPLRPMHAQETRTHARARSHHTARQAGGIRYRTTTTTTSSNICARCTHMLHVCNLIQRVSVLDRILRHPHRRKAGQGAITGEHPRPHSSNYHVQGRRRHPRDQRQGPSEETLARGARHQG